MIINSMPVIDVSDLFDSSDEDYVEAKLDKAIFDYFENVADSEERHLNFIESFRP